MTKGGLISAPGDVQFLTTGRAKIAKSERLRIHANANFSMVTLRMSWRKIIKGCRLICVNAKSVAFVRERTAPTSIRSNNCYLR